MKKTKILNAPLSYCIAQLGHTDSLTICDAGLPIPSQSERIDLALTSGIPSFLQTIETVIDEMFIDRVLLAEEIKQYNPNVWARCLADISLLEKKQGNKIKVDYVSHEIFKQKSLQSKAIVRTGECTPYANIILYSGVPF